MNVPKIVLLAATAASMLYNGMNENDSLLQMLSFGSAFFAILQILSDAFNWFAGNLKFRDIFIIVVVVLGLCRFGYKLSMSSYQEDKPHRKEVKLKAENGL